MLLRSPTPPCRPWRRSNLERPVRVMDKSRAVLALHNLSAIDATLPNPTFV